MKSAGHFLIIIILLILTDCSNSTNVNAQKDNVSPDSNTIINRRPAPGLDWKDSIVKRYVETTKNPLVSCIKKDTINGWAYIYDKDTERGQNFIAVRIGQSLPDHFATSGWLYIDTITKNIFELDMVNDTLVAVDKNK